VYTQSWVAKLLLNSMGYVPEADLTKGTLIEPCCGDGAFAVPIVQRLLASAKNHGVPPERLQGNLVFVDVDPVAVEATASAVAAVLLAAGVAYETTSSLLSAWFRVGDFLIITSALPVARWVVGNPPYLRVEDVPAGLTRRYRTAWGTMRGRADIYVGFWEAGLALLEPGGRIGYICADRWMRNQYGERLRSLVTTKYCLELILDMHHVDAFQERVSAYPAMVVVSAGEDCPARVIVGRLRGSFAAPNVDELEEGVRVGRADHESFEVWPVDSQQFGAEGWTFRAPGSVDTPGGRGDLLQTLPETGVTVRGGLATGADDAFIITGSSDVEPSLLRRIVGPSDIIDGALVWSGRRLLYPWTTTRGLIDLEAFPFARAHLSAFEERLRNRHVVRTRKGRDGWWRTIDQEPVSGYTGPALLIPDIRERVEPVLDLDEHVPMHSLYRLTSTVWDLEVLGAVLMSDLVHEQMRAMSVAMASGRMRVSAQYLKRLRIPTADMVKPIADDLARAFRRRDRRTASELVHAAVSTDLSSSDPLSGSD
jgi:adenine-specific DNA-methyltransferase